MAAPVSQGTLAHRHRSKQSVDINVVVPVAKAASQPGQCHEPGPILTGGFAAKGSGASTGRRRQCGIKLSTLLKLTGSESQTQA